MRDYEGPNLTAEEDALDDARHESRRHEQRMREHGERFVAGLRDEDR